MSAIDITAKKYFHNSNVISELLSFALHISPIDPSSIHFIETTSSLDSQPLHEYHRDLLVETLLLEYNHSRISIIGLEPQTYIDYSLPIRTMVYDAVSYDTQRNLLKQTHRANQDLTKSNYLSSISEDDIFKPVITVVIWLGTQPYSGPTKLSELMSWSNIDKHLFFDYGFLLIDCHKMEISQILQYETDLRELFLALRSGQSKEDLRHTIHDKNIFRNVSRECALLLNKSLKINGIIKPRKDGKVDMCKAIEEIRQEGFQNGFQNGFQDGFEDGISTTEKRIALKLLNEGKSYEYICNLVGIDISVLKNLK